MEKNVKIKEGNKEEKQVVLTLFNDSIMISKEVSKKEKMFEEETKYIDPLLFIHCSKIKKVKKIEKEPKKFFIQTNEENFILETENLDDTLFLVHLLKSRLPKRKRLFHFRKEKTVFIEENDEIIIKKHSDSSPLIPKHDFVWRRTPFNFFSENSLIFFICFFILVQLVPSILSFVWLKLDFYFYFILFLFLILFLLFIFYF